MLVESLRAHFFFDLSSSPTPLTRSGFLGGRSREREGGIERNPLRKTRASSISNCDARSWFLKLVEPLAAGRLLC